jgi:asparagine synthase (glutamine-hydrolysing)
MCGIFALISNIENNLISKEFYKGKNRGPEHSILIKQDNLNFKNNLYIGFHRLAINGLNNESNQPIEKDNIILICNGEIYNYKELYELINVIPNTDSDCEVIIHLYEKFGFQQTLRMLDGVFSIVLLDYRSSHENKLYIARDPYGVRPLFINDSKNKDESFLAIGSDLKMLNKLCDYDYEYKSTDLLNYEKNTIKQFLPGSYSEFSLLFENIRTTEINKKYISFPVFNFFKKQSLEEVYEKIIENLILSVKKRVETTERPIACLLSGGLDSSLICSLVNRELKLKNKGPLETYSIGLKGSDDLKYAKMVAEHLQTNHHELVVTENDMLNAIPEVIYNIESYDTTTVRASVGNYLISKYISQNSEAKVIFNGDGADELMGGYLYFHECPDSLEFDKECKRLLENIHFFDVLRSDKSISSNGLEARTPFLDRGFVQFYLSIHPDIRNHNSLQKCEKYLIRKAFDNFNFELKPLLPEKVLWRTKEAFSDGVSKNTRSWYEIIKEDVSKKIDTLKIVDKNLTLEQNYYLNIFDSHFTNQRNVIPYYWMPSYVDAKDSSARSLNIYKKINSEINNE